MMTNVPLEFASGKPVHVGIDVHRRSYFMTVQCQGEIVVHKPFAADGKLMIRTLHEFGASEVHTVMEAGPTGYWLHEKLVEAGFDSMVVAPTLVPDLKTRVKTDARDSKKLAAMLAGGMLRGIDVPTKAELADRQLVRTRERAVKSRREAMQHIKSLLLFHGVQTPDDLKDNWSKRHVAWLSALVWPELSLAQSMGLLMTKYRRMCEDLKTATALVKALAESKTYAEPVRLLMTIPGVGVLSAMTILTEIRDVKRFRNGKALASHLGMTPSERSSGEKQRRGGITKCGNRRARTALTECAWTLIRYDKDERAVYEAIKRRSGSRVAIMAIARRLALRIRRMLLDGTEYTPSIPAERRQAQNALKPAPRKRLKLAPMA
jgi:transposase